VREKSEIRGTPRPRSTRCGQSSGSAPAFDWSADSTGEIASYAGPRVAVHHHLPKVDEGQYVDDDPRSGDVVLWREPETGADRIEHR